MGSTTFCIVQRGSDAKEAFATAQAEAREESGSGGYSGTIAEAWGFTMYTRSTMSAASAENVASKVLDKDDYVEETARAIPVLLETREVKLEGISGALSEWQDNTKRLEAATALLRERKLLKAGEQVKSVALQSYVTERPKPSYYATSQHKFSEGRATVVVLKAGAAFTRTVRVVVAVDGDISWSNRAVWEQAAAAKVKLKAGEVITGTSIVSDRESKVVRKTKVKATASTGKAVTKYVVSNTRHATWETGFSTQAKARSWATTTLQELADQGRLEGKNLEIEAITRREDGGPLVEVTSTVVKATATIEVVVTKEPESTDVPDAWLFFGWASM